MLRRPSLRAVVLVAAAVLVLLVGLALFTQTSPFRGWVRGVIERQAEGYLRGELSIGRVEGNLITGIDLHDVRLTVDGETVVAADRVSARYDLLDLLGGPIALSGLTIERPTVHVRNTDDGLNLANLLEPGPEDAAARPFALEEMDIIDGTVTFSGVDGEAFDVPERLVNVNAQASLRRGPPGERMTVDFESLSFRGMNPSLRVDSLSGELAFGDGVISFDDLALRTAESQLQIDGSITGMDGVRRIDLQVESPNLAMQEFAPIIPALESYDVSPSVNASLQGTLDKLAVNFDIQTAEGNAEGAVTADVDGPARAVRGTVDVRNLNLSAFSDLEPSDITASGEIDLRFEPGGQNAEVSGTYDLAIPELTYGQYEARDLDARGRVDGRRVQLDVSGQAFGGEISAEGTVTLAGDGQPLRFDLEGQAAGVRADAVPEELLAGNLRPEGDASLAFRVQGAGDDLRADLRFRDFQFAGAELSEGTRVRVDRTRGRLQYSVDGSVASLDLQRLGRQAGFDAIAADRYASDLNARLDITGAGTDIGALTLQGTAVLSDSQLFGGHIPSMNLTFDLTRGAGGITARGQFKGINAARLANTATLAGNLTGMIDVAVTLPPMAGDEFDLQQLSASGQLLLNDSTLSGVVVDRAIVAGSLDHGLATIKALDANGPNLAVNASGVLALNRTGESSLTYTIDTPPLQQIEAIEAPVSGELYLEGRVTGNLTELRAVGKMSGLRVGYGDATALAAVGTYDVRVPDGDFTRADAQADAELTSLEAGGQMIPQVNAAVQYANRQLGFDVDLLSGERTASADGRLLFLPDRQQVELTSLMVESGTIQWRTPAASDAVIDYGGERLGIRNLRLEGEGGQSLSVNGVLGDPTATGLDVRATNVRLADVDALLEFDRGLEGLLDADVTVTGSLEKPTAEGRVNVTNGAIEGFTYETLVGTFDYEQRLIDVDARLSTAGGGWLNAEGRIPLEDESRLPLDLQLTSSRIDLGLVQGMTDEITNVTGAVEMQIHATGSLRDPTLNGFIDIDQGAFTAVLAQNHYTGLDTRLVFSGDLVEIQEFSILDDEQDALRVTGRAVTRRGRPRELAIDVHADGFEVMDNRFGELEMASQLRIAGEITSPRITGEIELESGTLNLDDVLDMLYSTGAIGDPVGRIGGPAQPAPDSTAPAAFTADVRLLIPDALVVQGTDLPAPNEAAPTGLGDVSLTIGGNVRITKAAGKAMELVGTISPVRGTYEFQGRAFEVLRAGGLTFTGGEINPALDITAQREISGVQARVQVLGTMREPRIELSSNPPLDDGEILSLIIFNQPLNALGSAQQVSLAQRALSLAAGFVTERLSESIADELELDLLELELVEEGELAPVVTIGEQFAEGVYVKVRQQLGSEAASAVLLEYEIDDWIRLVARFAERQGTTQNLFNRIDRGRIALEFRFRY